MKKIVLSNGEIRIGYEFDDLTDDVKGIVINDAINFEIEVMSEDSPYYDCALKMEQMRTPWFLGSYIYENRKEDIIETLKINEYLFDDEGEILPVLTHVGKNNEVIKHTFGKKQVECNIENF